MDPIGTEVTVGNLVAAIGALGTAAFGLVDASKVVRGGISNSGFQHIRQVVTTLLTTPMATTPTDTVAWHASVLGTLRANWLNGTPLADQKAIARSLIKLRLDEATALTMAARTGVDPQGLTVIAAKIRTGATLTLEESALFGRFDLILTAMLDEGYQRADQLYRNSAKAAAVGVSVVLACWGAWVAAPDLLWGRAILIGLIATPLAPVARISPAR